MTRITTIELYKDELNFSAGHFTIFSETARENLHGHNYYVGAEFKVIINDNGMAFDYRIYKKKLRELCSTLDLRFLLPAHSEYLKIEETKDLYIAHFNQEKIPFLKRDILILPVRNVTLEELSNWFLLQLIQNTNELSEFNILGIKISVFNGPGQSGSTYWGNI